MKTGWWQRLATLWRAELFSPRDFVRRALVITVLYAIVHLAGLREFTSFLSGTMGSTKMGWELSAFLGLTYLFAYLGFVLLKPVFLLAAGLLAIWKRWIKPGGIA